MVVQHNLRAMNSNRMLGLTTSAQAKSTEKLSSGYKINRAADDAAGLSISEKMRKQIRGLSQASLNAQDGISAVQTAEGALNEVQDMLQRMNELAVKAANGTMSEDDRSYIQNEIDQLVTEIDRVSETTKFNETYLLKGDGEDVVTKEVTYADLGGEKAIECSITTDKVASPPKTEKFTASTDTTTGLTTINLGKLDSIQAGDTLTIGGRTYTIADSDQASNAANDTINVDLNNGDAGQAVADKIAAAIQARNTTLAGAAATVNDADIASATALANPDGTFSLVLQSRTDDNRALTTANKNYKTDAGLELNGAAAAKLVSDGQEVVVGKVEYAGLKTDAAGTTAAVTIDQDKYTYGEMSFVCDGTTWSSTDGSFSGLTDTDMAALGLTTTAAKGDVINITKSLAADTTGQLIFANVNGAAMDLSDYEVGDEVKVKLSVNENGIISVSDVPRDTGVKALNFSLQVGADTTAENKISVDIEAMSAKNLGVDGLKVDGKDSTNADKAVDVIAAAIQKVSTQRSALGAVQNRLEHTIANLDNVVENTTAAESQIRDTDMATEMVKYSNNNILAQAGQSMLAQSNQANQGVLALLG